MTFFNIHTCYNYIEDEGRGNLQKNCYENVPQKTSVRFCEQNNISRAALHSTTKKCGFSSYKYLKNQIRFRCDIKTCNAISILFDLKNIVETDGYFTNQYRIYEYIYQTYCDLEESNMSYLDVYILSELETVLLDFENVFSNRICYSDIKQNIISKL